MGDAGVADVLHRTTKELRRSVNDPDFPTITWIINPDLSAVTGFASKYWIITGDVVTLMNLAARDVVDAAEATAATQENRDQATDIVDAVTGLGVETRALIELLNKRDNYLVNRVEQLQQALDAVKASVGAADSIRAAIPANWLATATRTKPDAVDEYKADIAAGNQDT